MRPLVAGVALLLIATACSGSGTVTTTTAAATTRTSQEPETTSTTTQPTTTTAVPPVPNAAADLLAAVDATLLANSGEFRVVRNVSTRSGDGGRSTQGSFNSNNAEVTMTLDGLLTAVLGPLGGSTVDFEPGDPFIEIRTDGESGFIRFLVEVPQILDGERHGLSLLCSRTFLEVDQLHARHVSHRCEVSQRYGSPPVLGVGSTTLPAETDSESL